jgi:PHD/YefM family antitoxin component YafN of YafNO toxin-antitoxin module
MTSATLLPDGIHSLTDFQRNAKKHIHRLKKSGCPHVLTVNGRAEVVVQDAKAYQEILERLDYLEAVQGVKEGLRGMARGEGKPAGEALAQIRSKVLATMDE